MRVRTPSRYTHSILVHHQNKQLPTNSTKSMRTASCTTSVCASAFSTSRRSARGRCGMVMGSCGIRVRSAASLCRFLELS